MTGLSHKHHRGVAGGRWKQKAPVTKRLFRPNLQTVWVKKAGKRVKMRLCAKCIKRIKFEATVKSKPVSSPIATA